jgi:hypothetical protein
MLKRLKNRLKFELEQIILRGSLHRLLLITLIIVGVSAGAGFIVYSATPNFADYGDAVWWAFLRLTDPGYLGDDEGVLVRIVSTTITLLGFVLFIGALIAIMVQAFNTALARLQLGLTPIAENGHFLILGWTNRTATIVKELLLSEKQARSFLRRRGARGFNIVILVDELSPALVQELRDELGKLYNGRKITLRSGSPLRLDHLRRVDYLNAAAILLPLPETPATSGTSPDARALKILLSIGSGAGRGKPMPLLVSELADAQRSPMAERAYGGPIEVLPSDRLISRLVVQTVRHAGLSYVYTELFTHARGSELYAREAGTLAGRSFGELRESFPRAMLLGLLRGPEDKPQVLLNPPGRLVVEAEDRLVLIAQSAAAVGVVMRESGAPVAAAAPVPRARRSRRRVLLLGWSMRIPGVLRELDAFEDEMPEVCILSTVPTAERERILSRQPPLRRVRLQHADGDYAHPGEVARLAPASYDNIVMLASDRLESDVDADTRTVLGYLMLQECLHGVERRPAVLVELLDPGNVNLFRTRPDEVLLTPLILSHMLAQVTLRRELSTVFDELFRSGGPEVDFQSVSSLGLADRSMRFRDVQRLLASQGRTALGLRIAGERADLHGGVHLNPPHDRSWLLRAADEVVVLV